MRKIEIKEHVDKKAKRNKIIASVVLGAIMLFSSLGYAFFNYGSNNANSTPVTTVTQKGLEFTKTDVYWGAVIGGKNFYFTYLPNETRTLDIKKTVADYQQNPLYYTRVGVAEAEIDRNLRQLAGRTQTACLQGTNCTDDSLPIKNCSNQMIITQDANFSVVREEDNCVYIISNDSVRDADAFLYKILGVN